MFFGERGCLEAETVGAKQVYFYPSGQNDDPLILRPSNQGLRKKNGEFSLQLFNFADSIICSTKKYVLGEEAIATMSVVDKCYDARTLLVQPWEIKHLEPFFEEKINDK